MTDDKTPSERSIILDEIKSDFDYEMKYRDRLETKAELVAGFSSSITGILSGLIVIESVSDPRFIFRAPLHIEALYIIAMFFFVLTAILSLWARWFIPFPAHHFSLEGNLDILEKHLGEKIAFSEGPVAILLEPIQITEKPLIKGKDNGDETQETRRIPSLKELVEGGSIKRVRDVRIFLYFVALKGLVAANEERQNRLKFAAIALSIGVILIFLVSLGLGWLLLSLII